VTLCTTPCIIAFASVVVVVVVVVVVAVVVCFGGGDRSYGCRAWRHFRCIRLVDFAATNFLGLRYFGKSAADRIYNE
jgi:hypothetical protein